MSSTLPEFLMSGVKKVDPVQIPIRVLGSDGMVYEVASYPLDRGVTKIFHSRAGGFVPPEAGADSAFSQLHYGEGAFEGMRLYYTPFGVSLVMPSRSYARLMNSLTVFHPVLARLILERFGSDSSLSGVELPTSLTPRAFYDLAEMHYQAGTPMTYPVRFYTSSGGVIDLNADLSLQIVCERSEVRTFGMKELDTVLKVLAFTGRLVSIDHFPNGIAMMEAGYVRPWGWVAGEAGLKIPTVIVERDPDGRPLIRNKPMYFSAATLPWTLYLKSEDYDTGLDVLVSPYPRIGSDMVTDAKIAGHYVNSALAINLAAMLGFGEILALNARGLVTEGSAENLFVLIQEGSKFVALTPPSSSGCLPGTVRDGMIRALEGMGVEVRYNAPSLEECYTSVAIILTGTGAQLIHVHSITELSAAKKIADMARLRSEEETGAPNRLTREDFNGDRKLVNGGAKHPLVEQIQAAYARLFLENPRLLQPVFNIDFPTFSELVGVDLKDFTQPKDRADIRAGYFGVVGLKDQDEIRARYFAVARMLSEAFKKAPKPGAVPVTKVFAGK